MEGLEQNLLTIAFNSMGGSTDIRLPIELDVVNFEPDGSRIRSDKAKSDFLACAVVLLDDSQ